MQMTDAPTIDRITGWVNNQIAAAPAAGTAAPDPMGAGMLSSTPSTSGVSAAQAAGWQSATSPSTPNTPTAGAPGSMPYLGDVPKAAQGTPSWMPPPYQAPQPPASVPPVTPTGVAVGAPTQINPASLAQRTVNPATETVQGQLGTILADNSPVLQQARAAAMRSAEDRGMINSAMAISGGEDAAIRAATSIAGADASTYGRAADYNAAASNQATMYNADQSNLVNRTQAQLDSESLARAQQLQQTEMQNAISKYQSDVSSATSRYNTDANYRLQADNSAKTLANNIINNMNMSPDRKSAMLQALGMGSAPVRNPDGSITPGTGMAGAVYVIDSTSPDLQYGGQPGASNPYYRGTYPGQLP